MKPGPTVEELLRWRLARAEADAPRAPRGARLLELARPWWETWPERFESLVERLGRIQIAYGHAMAETSSARSGHPVPALVVGAGEDLETTVRVLYLSVRDGRLRLRFQLSASPTPVPGCLEATLVGERSGKPLLTGPATLSGDCEYRIDEELSEELAPDWESLRVTDRMPFRLILRADQEGG